MKMHKPLHPGQFIRQVYLDPFGISANRAAKYLVVVPSTFGRLLNGTTGVSPDMALRLAIVFGRSPESWLAMQNCFDLWKQKQVFKANKLKPLPVVIESTNTARRGAQTKKAR